MNIIYKSLILFLSLICIFANLAFAEPLFSAESDDLVFQIGHEGLICNKATVASAIIQPLEESYDQCSVLIKLNTYANQQLEAITEHNIGKTAVISFNGKIISSPRIQNKLSWELVVTGFSRKEAEQFINNVT